VIDPEIANQNSVAEISATLLLAAALSTVWFREARAGSKKGKWGTGFVVLFWLVFIWFCSFVRMPTEVVALAFLALLLASGIVFLIQARALHTADSSSLTVTKTTTTVRKGTQYKLKYQARFEHVDEVAPTQDPTDRISGSGQDSEIDGGAGTHDSAPGSR
jgi:hypothetical protein